MNRDDWRGLVKPLLIVALIVSPSSFIGSPPLIFQWLNNLVNPAPQNEFYWSINNISLSSYLSPLTAVVVLLFSFSTLFALMKWQRKRWNRGHTLASLLLITMTLSPYTSQQSFSSALAFIPSWISFFTQSIVLIISFRVFEYWDFIPPLILLIGIISLYFYQPAEKTRAHESHAPIKVN